MAAYTFIDVYLSFCSCALGLVYYVTLLTADLVKCNQCIDTNVLYFVAFIKGNAHMGISKDWQRL